MSKVRLVWTHSVVGWICHRQWQKPLFMILTAALINAYVETSHKSLTNATCEVLKHKNSNNNETSSSDIVNTKVSGDGAFQNGGYSWLNGVVTLIANGKCIGSEVMSKKCKQCDIWESKKDTQEYTDWRSEHSCSINHEGSARAMEVNGLKRMFSWFIHLHKLRYNFYIGDGAIVSVSMKYN